MLEILEKLIAILTTDATLNAIVPVTNVFTGPVDQLNQSQESLPYPGIFLSLVSEVSRSVPLNTRDSHVAIDIYSRNSQLEVENIYERIITLLNYFSGDEGGAHIFWQRLNGAADLYETDRRIFHRSTTFVFWAIKPNP